MKTFDRGEKRMLGLSVGALAILVGAGTFKSARDAEPNWQIPAPVPTPEPNGFDLYVAAQKAVIPFTPPIDQAYDTKRVTDPKEKATRHGLARRTAWEKQNSRAWTLFERARAVDSRHPASPERGGPMFPFGPVRAMARYKIALSNTCKMRGDWNGALKHGLDTIEMGGDGARGGPLIGWLEGAAVQSMSQDIAREAPSHLNAEQARQNIKRLEELLAVQPSFVDAMREEKWDGLRRLRDTLKNPEFNFRDARQLDEKAPLREIINTRLVSKRAIVSSYIEAADANIRAAQSPYHPRENAETTPDASNTLNRWLNQSWTRSKFSAARNETQISLLLLRLALRAHRVETGAYPTNLNVLAPKYLAKIPVDSFAQNAPFGYRKVGDSYLLWSVGPDAKNNDGAPILPRGKRKTVTIRLDSIGDVVARP